MLQWSFRVGRVAFGCLAFATFLAWLLLTVALMVFGEQRSPNFGVFAAAGLMLIQLYCLAYFKAEVGRGLIALQAWKAQERR